MREQIINNLKEIDAKFPNLNKEWKLKYDELILSVVDENRGIKKLENHGDIYDNHHAFPKSIGGLDEKHNLVKLTHQEHFLSHVYLFNMLKKTEYGRETKKMGFAHKLQSTNPKYTCPEEWKHLKKEYDVEQERYYQEMKLKGGSMAKPIIGIFNGVEYYFKSQVMAIRKSGVDKHIIGKILLEQGGWKFRDCEDKDRVLINIEYSKEHWKGIKFKRKKQINKSKCKSIIHIDLNNNYTFISTIYEVQEITTFGRVTILKCADGNYGFRGHKFMWATKLEIEEGRYIESETRVSESPNKRKPTIKKYSGMKRIKK